MKQQKYSRNYLDMVPKRKCGIEWQVDDGIVVLRLEHRGFYHKIAQTCFHRPRFSSIRLDELGSFIWEQIDGGRCLQDIARLVKQKFGAAADPLYDRFVRFVQILSQNGLVELRKVERNAG